MTTYILLFLVSAFVSLVTTPVIRRLCERYGLLDVPADARRLHVHSVPRLGGIAIFVSVVSTLALMSFFNVEVAGVLRLNKSQLVAVCIPATLVFISGIYDDIRGANARIKLGMQIIAGLIFCILGGRIDALSLPFVGSVALHPLAGSALLILWIVGITNAFNLIDGMDGLAAGTALFASLVMLIVSLVIGQPFVTMIAAVLCGCLIGFLRYNFNPASIFLGDSGALLLGFLLASLSVYGTQKASTAVAVSIPLLAFGVPVVDTSIAVVRRFLSRKPLFEGDREHLHHMLLQRGWSQRHVAISLYGLSAFFGLLALLLVHDSGTRMTGMVLFVVGVSTLFIIGHLRYHEMDEVKAGVKRNLIERRIRVASNIRVRRASRAMAGADNLDKIFAAFEELLAAGEFYSATARIECPEIAQTAGGALLINLGGVSNGEKSNRRAIEWSWQRPLTLSEENLNANRLWNLRLPLATPSGVWGEICLYRPTGAEALLMDINYLCDLFQREMALAVERAVTSRRLVVSDDRFNVNIAAAS